MYFYMSYAKPLVQCSEFRRWPDIEPTSFDRTREVLICQKSYPTFVGQANNSSLGCHPGPRIFDRVRFPEPVTTKLSPRGSHKPRGNSKAAGVSRPDWDVTQRWADAGTFYRLMKLHTCDLTFFSHGTGYLLPIKGHEAQRHLQDIVVCDAIFGQASRPQPNRVRFNTIPSLFSHHGHCFV